jgi:hypothetical protein
MKTFAVFLFPIFIFVTDQLNGQSITVLKAKKEVLLSKKRILEDSIRHLTALIEVIERIEREHPHTFKTVTTTSIQLIPDDRYDSKFSGFLNKGDSIKIYDVEEYKYLIRSNSFIGFITKGSFEETKDFKKYTKLIAKEHKSKKQEKKFESYSESTPMKSYSSGSYSGGSSKTIHTGPRGGQYYINSHGNKTYVKRRK